MLMIRAGPEESHHAVQGRPDGLQPGWGGQPGLLLERRSGPALPELGGALAVFSVKYAR